MNPLETYLKELFKICSSGEIVKETSYYGPLPALLNDIGKTLKPQIKCIINLQNQSAGLPDGGLFTQDQFQKAGDHEPMAGQMPARGVIEVKGVGKSTRSILLTPKRAPGSRDLRDYFWPNVVTNWALTPTLQKPVKGTALLLGGR
jgi:hypothetical protein